MQGNGLKFKTSRTGLQTSTIHTLPEIARSKGNQIMKSGELLEFNMTNIFLEKSCTKYGKKTIPRTSFLASFSA